MILVLTSYALIALLTIALYNWLTADRLEDLSLPAEAPRPKVSVLIPARDEADNLHKLLPMLTQSDYQDVEILVLDDESRDATAEVVRTSATQDARIRLLQGKPLPDSWGGKSWACHQLAQEASGEILLFIDADMRPSPKAISRTVAWMQSQKLACLTVLPYQEMVTWAEQAVVPLVLQVPVMCLLPLRHVATFPSELAVFANGQWLAFTREAYQAIGGHEAVRAELLEDFALARRLKRQGGLRLLPVIATRDLSVRMCRDWDGVKKCFSRSLYLLTGGTEVSLAVFMIIGAMLFVMPWLWVLTGHFAWIIPLLLLIAIRLVVRRTFRSPYETVIAHPVGAVMMLHLLFDSYTRHQNGDLDWKGRKLRSVRHR